MPWANRDERLAYHRAYYRANREKYLSNRRVYYASNRDKCIRESRDYQLKVKYGITQADYDRMLKEQSGCCRICGSDSPGRVKNFHVDHCHVTGKVRGLLCVKCNMALGWYEANSEKITQYVSKGNGNG